MDFELASGSVIGRHHALSAKNNQDAFLSVQTPDATIAVVCDGCGSRPHSEVGAKLGAAFVADALTKIRPRPDWCVRNEQTDFWEDLNSLVRSSISTTALLMDRSDDAIRDFFLFTVVGAYITEDSTRFFAAGDGVIAVNGKVTSLGPFENNAPPYLANHLLRGVYDPKNPWKFNIKLVREIPTSQLENFLIGTDGVDRYLDAAAKGSTFPGKDALVEPLSSFWEQDRYFANPDMLRRTLAKANIDHGAPDADGWSSKEAGLLTDDTTIIVGRRKRPAPTATRDGNGC